MIINFRSLYLYKAYRIIPKLSFLTLVITISHIGKLVAFGGASIPRCTRTMARRSGDDKNKSAGTTQHSWKITEERDLSRKDNFFKSRMMLISWISKNLMKEARSCQKMNLQLRCEHISTNTLICSILWP